MTTSRPPGRTSGARRLDQRARTAPARRDTSGGASRHLSSGCLRSVPVPVHGRSSTTRSKRPLHGGRRASAATSERSTLQPAQVVAQRRQASRRGVGQHALDARLDRLAARRSCRRAPRRRRGRARPGAAAAAARRPGRLVLHVEVAAREGRGLRAAMPLRTLRPSGDSDDASTSQPSSIKLSASSSRPPRSRKASRCSGFGRLLAVEQLARRRLAEARPPTVDQEVGMAQLDRQPPHRVALLDRPRLEPRVARDAAQHGVDEAGAAAVRRLQRVLDRLVDHRVVGHAIEEEELVGAEAQRREQRGLDALQRTVARQRQHMIDAAQPAQGAEHELPQQADVARVAARAGALRGKCRPARATAACARARAPPRPAPDLGSCAPASSDGPARRAAAD